MKRSHALAVGVAVALAPVVIWAIVTGGWLIALLVVGAYVAGTLILLLIEARRYKAVLETAPGPPWTATSERFVDPESGRNVAVYENPTTGERAYVAFGEAASDRSAAG